MIDTAALAHNLARVRELAPGCRVMAVIKANAYGHGLVPVARSLAQADAFAVARIEEALDLREAGIAGRIVLLEGVRDAGELGAAARHGLELVVHQEKQVALLDSWRDGASFDVWLKADTGMGRLGFRPAHYAAAHARLAASAAVRKPVRLMTHLADSESGAEGRTAEQLACFATIASGLPGERCIANSAGIIAWPEARADWVRPGIMLYGVSPFPGRTGAALGLRPAMRFESGVLAIRDVSGGERVGYGGTWTAPGPARIAIVGAGYGDGYPRSAANGTPILVGGRAARLAGRVSMDMLAADVSESPGTAVGDPVLLWGPDLPVETVAAAAGTIGYELTCRVSRRVPFEYVAA